MFHEMLLKLYFVKCSEKNISQCILASRASIFKGSYISLTHKHLPAPTHTQPKKGHTHPNSPTPTQKRGHTHPYQGK